LARFVEDLEVQRNIDIGPPLVSGPFVAFAPGD